MRQPVRMGITIIMVVNFFFSLNTQREEKRTLCDFYLSYYDSIGKAARLATKMFRSCFLEYY